MEIYNPSRRRDLLVGSLASTLIVCLGVWLSGEHPLEAQPGPTKVPVTRLTPLPPITDDDATPPPMGDPVKAERPPEPSVPQLPDAPQVPKPDSIVQPIEPPPPDSAVDSRRIPDNWSRVGPAIKVFDPSALDQQPVPRFQARPQYPAQMRQEGIAGEAVVDFIVDTNGNVRNATAIRASNGQFGDAAVAAVSRWTFKPGRKNGHAVFTHMQVPIEFTLDGSRP